ISTTAGVTRSGTTLIFDSSFNTTAGFTFSVPTVDDSLIEGNETYTVTLATPTTNATGTGLVALGTASVTTTIVHNDTATASLPQPSTSVTEGSAATYTIHFTNPIDTSVTVSVPLNISLPGVLGGAEPPDIPPIPTRRSSDLISTTAGVTRSGTTLIF